MDNSTVLQIIGMITSAQLHLKKKYNQGAIQEIEWLASYDAYELLKEHLQEYIEQQINSLEMENQTEN